MAPATTSSLPQAKSKYGQNNVAPLNICTKRWRMRNPKMPVNVQWSGFGITFSFSFSFSLYSYFYSPSGSGLGSVSGWDSCFQHTESLSFTEVD